MNFSTGIRQLVFCTRDTLGTPAFNYPIFLGLGNEGKYSITDKPVKGYRDEDLPFLVNHKVEMKTFQMDFFVLARLLFHCGNRGADCQIVTEKIAPLVYAGVYNLSGVNFPGIDFEWIHSNNESSLSLTAEVSLPESVSAALIHSAETNIPLDLPAIDEQYGNRGINQSLYRSPNFGSIQTPTGMSLVNGYEVIDRTFSIKTVSKKLANDRSSVKWLKVFLEVTIDKSAAVDLTAYLNKTKNGSLTFQEKVNETTNFTYNFDNDLFFRKHEFVTDKNSGHIKLSFEKNFPLYDFEVNTANNILSVSSAV